MQRGTPATVTLEDALKLRKITEEEPSVDPDLPVFPVNLFACGSGSYGRLAQGPNKELDVTHLHQCCSYTPVAFTQLACGAGHTLALDTKGSVWSWGKCHFGQLGHGKAWKDERLPKRIESLTGKILQPSFSNIVLIFNIVYRGDCVDWYWLVVLDGDEQK